MSAEPAATNDEEEDTTLTSLDDLFIDKSYTLRHYTFTPAQPITSASTPPIPTSTPPATITATPPYHITAYSLHQATTAYDLTGQLVWPATDILASYLLSSLASTLLAPPLSVVELGCGVGLLSLLCLHLSPPPVALHCTDHNPHVLSLLQTNLTLQQQQQPIPTHITTQPLDWRDPDLSRLPPHLSLILGSDLVYSTVDVEALVRLLYAILARHRSAVAVVSWLTRWHNVDQHMHDTLELLKAENGSEGGLVWEEIELEGFMQLELFDERVGRDGHLLCIRWKDK